MSRLRITLLGVFAIALLLSPSVASAEFSMTGYLQTQAGVFTSTAENWVDEEGYPVDHGDLFGRMSMFRNTLQLEADYSPTSRVNLHAVFRGVRSAALTADNWAQVPEFRADTTFNNNEAVQEKKRKWVRDTYYTENDLRELFLDVEATNWLSFRFGRQQVSWGETGSFKLLDVINPENTTWHLGPFEAFEDTRVPLWIAKSLIDIQPLQGSLELVWAPLIDKPENTVTVPLTFVGAWGLPVAPKNEFSSKLIIKEKKLVYPAEDLRDSRLGARWKGIMGPVNYSLVYYYSHHLSPPILSHAEKNMDNEMTIYLNFPRQQIMGGSVEYAIPRPISTVMRVEAAFLPDKPYNCNSLMSPGRFPDGIHEWRPSPNNPDNASFGDPDYKLMTDFYHEEKDTLSYAVVLMRANQIRWLNKHNSIITQFQIFQSIITEDIAVQEELPDGSKVDNDNWYIVAIPGYDTTEVKEVSTTFVGALVTSYFHGLFNPMIIGVYVPDKSKVEFDKWKFDGGNHSALLSARAKFVVGNHWRFEAGVNQIYGHDPYKGLGLFRDRDEVYGKIRFQF